MLIDTHCHVLSEYYDSIDEVVNNYQNNQVSKIINQACNEKEVKEILELVKKYPSMYGAIGLHPENVEEPFDYSLLKRYDKIVAIGEIGLDYHYEGYDSKKQIEVLDKQLTIAEELHLPVVIHCRDAYPDMITILRKHHNYGAIHSFSGTLEEAKSYIELGFYLGVNGIVTFKNNEIAPVIKSVGLEHVLLETDSPYLTPVPYRGKKNEPAHVFDVACYLACLFEIPYEEVARITTENAGKVFDL